MYLLGVRFDNLDKREVLKKIEGFLTDGRQHYIVLPYAEFLVEARKDEEFREILNQADLSLSDGFGPVLTSHITSREALKGRIMGVDLIWALFARFGSRHPMFLFGAKEGVAAEAADRLLRHPERSEEFIKDSLPHRDRAQNNNIQTLNGYVSDEEAIEKINKSGAEILLVALGAPKQEKWIFNNLKKMPGVKVAMGVGGAFDFISGRVRRAPRFVQKIGFEWLWRLFFQPKHWRKTWRSVVVFSWLVFKEKFR